MNKTLLYVENDPVDVVAVRKALLDFEIPFDLYDVEEGNAALAYLSGKGIHSNRDRFPLPDVLLVNMRPEAKHPLEVVEWVRAQKQFRNLTILVHSNALRAADIKDANESGANACFAKTINSSKLLDYLRKKIKACAVREACAARDRATRSNT